MRHRNNYAVAVFSFILGCILALSISNYEICIEITQETASKRHSEVSLNKIASYVALIMSNPDNFARRKAIRNTWLKLKAFIAPSISPLSHEPVAESKEFEHYFVVGVSTVSDKVRSLLRNEQAEFGDLLILPQLNDQYTKLSEKLMQSIKWVNLHYPNLLYLLKCDDDSFVRIDKLIQELKMIRKKSLESSRNSVMYSASDGKFEKKQNLLQTGLYWGYFIGKAKVKFAGRWAENDFFLCDKYLPYALGGGYVISDDIIDFIARNSHFLRLFKSEDVSMGVWTAPLSNVQRLHDIRFDTEWATRGCNHSHIIRHKQTAQEMEEMYATLMGSHNTRLCRVPALVRIPYDYNWAVPPSLCCRTKEN